MVFLTGESLVVHNYAEAIESEIITHECILGYWSSCKVKRCSYNVLNHILHQLYPIFPCFSTFVAIFAHSGPVYMTYNHM